MTVEVAVDSIESAVTALRRLLPDDHPTADAELRGMWRAVESVRNWLEIPDVEF
jgi:hypothetical protein